MVANLVRDVNLYEVKGEDSGYTEADFESLHLPFLKNKMLTHKQVKNLRGLINDTTYINLQAALYLIPFRDLPKYIHEKNETAKAIIKWRITIGK